MDHQNNKSPNEKRPFFIRLILMFKVKLCSHFIMLLMQGPSIAPIHAPNPNKQVVTGINSGGLTLKREN